MRSLVRPWIVVAGMCALLGAGESAATHAAEEWSDPRLPVRDGLELWLDASRVSGEPAATTPLRLDQWRDASGNRRDVKQDVEEARPQRLAVGDSAVVRFDGTDDHLRVTGLQAHLNSFQIFLVASSGRNFGAFRGFLAFNAKGQRDYSSGLTVDLGPDASPRFSVLNVEGAGFGGARNLRKGEGPFDRLHVIEVSSLQTAKSVRLAVDGIAEGERPREGDSISLDEITVGARYYHNGPGPQKVDGHSQCDIAEILVYGRVLSPAETDSVREYLAGKHASAKSALPPHDDGKSERLVSVAEPPAIQVFLPGFRVRELPLDLPNINNVKYRPDGTLVALAYDGNVWLLRDTNGDGLEDQASQFWENKSGLRSPIGIDLTPPGYPQGDGLFVVGKNRFALIVDLNGDGKADKEIEIASGWKESKHSVDGLGVAFDARDGSVYFGRGSFNYLDPLLRDSDGQAHYSLADESGAILRVSPDLKSREIVATGIRFPVALRINRHGDLFSTDQEGATWVPNGNPFDELLHIQQGRHFGFPARHPKFVPNVIDEPSTFDYGPQHQSTCGLNFNEPVKPGGPVFGPKEWAGDAIVCGYSRGKLYRTQLVKSAAGYVARTQLLACLKMLTIDACVGPRGELTVACHSGGPDWGSGPSGKGKLFKITYEDASHPQPALVWPSGPREVRVEFDRAVDPAHLKNVLERARLTGGRYVRAGDRFESLWPGYASVQLQKVTPRYNIPLRSAQLTADGRTLVLATDSVAAAGHLALTLPGMGRPSLTQPGAGAVPQHPALDLDFDVSGCEATWLPTDGSASWNGWLPHLDLRVAREWTRGSAWHDVLWSSIAKPGRLRIQARLNLTDMLRPEVQQGSRIDYEYPPESVTVLFDSRSGRVTLVSPADVAGALASTEAQASLTVAAHHEKIVNVSLQLDKNSGPESLDVRWHTNEDERTRPLPLRRILVPWADLRGKKLETSEAAPPAELAGGSWSRGRKEFFGEQAGCAKCHRVQGQGGDLGPDLSNLVHRDYASVVRDIVNPSFAINPDHLSYSILLNDGRVMSGVVRTVADKLRIGDNKGIVTEVSLSDIEEMKPLPISTMPEDLAKVLDGERLRDLLTFLLTPAPRMPRDYPGKEPKPRTAAEVRAVLAGAPDPLPATRPLRIVLVAGPKDHGPGEHDYPAWQKAWKELLAAGDKVEISTAWEWPTSEATQSADVMIFYQRGDWNDQRAAEIDRFLERGGGLVYIHWAVEGRKFGHEFAQRIGLASLGGVSFRHGELTLDFDASVNHPVTRNFHQLPLVDETYWKMVGSLPANRFLATAVEEGHAQPQIWSLEPRNGRVFVCIPGHYSWTFDDPLFRVLLLRAIAWTAREPVDRFNELVWPGADFTP